MDFTDYKIFYKEVKKIDSEEVEFLIGNANENGIGIYDTDYYPLLRAEDLEVISTSTSHYIIERVKNKIVNIYNSKARKIFEVKENQTIELLKDNLEDFDISLKNTNRKDCLFININENGKSILYNVTNSTEILMGAFENSTFHLTNDFILEEKSGAIRAIYLYSLIPILIIKSEENSLKLISFLHDYYITENSDSGKCHSIYYINNDSCHLLLENDNYDLNLYLSYYHSVINNYEAETMIITGMVEEKCKAIFFLDNYCKKVRRYRVIKNDDRKYFEIDANTGIIKVMCKEKCIKLLDCKFNNLLSVRYRKDANINIYFEIHSEYIAKMYKEKCIAIYSLKSQELLASTDNLNINIKTCKSKKNDLYFLYMLNDMCVKIKGTYYTLSSPNIEYYDVHISPIDNTLDYVYGIRNEKVTAIFNFELKYVDWLKLSSDESFEVISTFMYTVTKEDIFHTEYKCLRQKILYLKNNTSSKAIEVLDENKNSLLKASENGYLKLVKNALFAYDEYNKCYLICFINNTEIVKSVSATTDYFIPLISKNEKLFIRKVSISNNNESLYYFQNKDFIEIVSNYEELGDCGEFLLALKNKSKTVEMVEVKTFYSKKLNFKDLTSKYNGILKLEVDDPKKFIYVMEEVNNKNIAIYSASKDGFDEVLYCDSGIEPIYVGTDIFFKTSEGIFSKVGNKI